MSRDHKTADGKIRVEYVPYELLEQAGCAMSYGLAKHGKAMSWEDNTDPQGWLMYAGATLRHVGNYLRSRLTGGDGRDPESGLLHLAGAAASLSILLRMEAKRGNLPTVWKTPPPRVTTIDIAGSTKQAIARDEARNMMRAMQAGALDSDGGIARALTEREQELERAATSWHAARRQAAEAEFDRDEDPGDEA